MTEDEATSLVLDILKPFARDEEAFAKADSGSRIWEDLRVNSARFIDILLAFEDRFGITVDEEDAETANTVGDVARLIQRFAAENPEVEAKARAARDGGAG